MKKILRHVHDDHITQGAVQVTKIRPPGYQFEYQVTGTIEGTVVQTWTARSDNLREVATRMEILVQNRLKRQDAPAINELKKLGYI